MNPTVVADTNVAVSGLLWHGAPAQVLDAGRLGLVELHSSQPLLDELAQVLLRPKFRERIEHALTTRQSLLDAYGAIVALCQPIDVGNVVVAMSPTSPSGTAIP